MPYSWGISRLSSLKNQLVVSTETMLQSCEVFLWCLAAILFFPARVCVCRSRPSAEKEDKRWTPFSSSCQSGQPQGPLNPDMSRWLSYMQGGWRWGLGPCAFRLVWPARRGKPEGQREAPDRRKKEQLFWLSLTFQMWSNLITSHPNTLKLQNILKPQEPVRYESVWIQQTVARLLVQWSPVSCCVCLHILAGISPHIACLTSLGLPVRHTLLGSEPQLGCLLVVPWDPQPGFSFSHSVSPSRALTHPTQFVNLLFSPPCQTVVEAELCLAPHHLCRAQPSAWRSLTCTTSECIRGLPIPWPAMVCFTSSSVKSSTFFIHITEFPWGPNKGRNLLLKGTKGCVKL